MTDFEQFSQKRRTIKENVEWLIQKFPFTKNDYRKLLQMYWYHVDNLKRFIPFEELEKMTQPESITRAFRELSSMRRIPRPHPIVQEARAIEQEHYQEYFGRKKRERDEFW